MTDENEWYAANRDYWDERAPLHVASEFYGLEAFLADPAATTLRPFEIAEVGDVAGLTLVHPQCHFGMDTLSWARRGARVTGLDISDRALVVVTHDARIFGFADRIARMDDGRIPEVVRGAGAPRELHA